MNTIINDKKQRRNEASNNWKKRNPEKVKEAKRKYTEKNLEKVRAKTKEFNDKYRQEHKEELRLAKKKYYEENKRSVIEKAKKYYEDNKAKVKAKVKEWRHKYPHKLTAQINRRRTRKTGAGGSYTEQEWVDLCNRYDNKCVCCGKETRLYADHVIPVSKRGTSFISNIQPLCTTCNSKKHTDTIDYR